MAFGGDGSCVAEVTFQAASEWVFGRNLDVSEMLHTGGVVGAHGASTNTCPKNICK